MKKAQQGTVVKTTKKIKVKKAQNGANTMEGIELPEFTLKASKIVDKPSKPAKPQKNYSKSVAKSFNKANRFSIKRGALKKVATRFK